MIIDNQFNVCAVPGGKIMVYAGLVDQFRPTDDVLGVVLGHSRDTVVAATA